MFKPPDTGDNHLRRNGQRRGRARTGIFRKECVDVDLNGSAPVGDATEQADMKNSQGESVSDAEPDEALKEFEALMTANDIIIRSAFYYILLPSLFAMALPLLLYELLELHDRRRL